MTWFEIWLKVLFVGAFSWLLIVLWAIVICSCSGEEQPEPGCFCVALGAFGILCFVLGSIGMIVCW